ncbi:peptide MFS transporter [Streptococcus parauberis]|uniref:peptide MFS transporter n=1 Tax=Streptococcus parauberis TaxID=1348 RepID=UPI000789C09B|nr:peptide MFS transporter [Streptococcus parauberis]KYP16931.1 Di-/tripeptide transporter [Streptococcus parauberis]KYP18270.1 Di-/tripeptide transporter [Streptococcus parauberis]KYP20479.1 Di-/tripeptide transporter [Streptococcus parauberis]KYP24681.1 Di-/tripeptide transporter [Streptococcus parauberis]KYP27060.1 Di-/tripeptide transporter [Streptococcus parauberis]
MNQADTKTFFGHPRGLSTLFFTEMWERFSYYGMRAILLYYMYYSVADGGLGFDKATAASIMAIYGSLVYLSSVLGGYISDRILGSRKTVLYGGILIMLGHIALATPFGKTALFFSIALIIFGTGLLKPNVSDMVGSLYAEKDLRRDAGFSIFVFGINLGAFIAPALVGYLGQEVNFHLGFSLAAIGMLLGLIQYVRDGNKYLSPDSLVPSDPLSATEKSSLIKKAVAALVAITLVLLLLQVTGLLSVDLVINFFTIVAIVIPIYYFVSILKSKKITSEERSHVFAYIPLFIASILFWSIEEQGAVVLALFADEQTRLYFTFFGHHINFPSSYFQSINPLFIMLYVPIFAWMWAKLGSKQPSSAKKFSFGLMASGLSFVWMAIPVMLFGSQARVSPMWLIMSWAIVIVGEMLISPIGLSVTNKLAPKAFKAQMMSIWFLSNASAQALNAQFVKFYTDHTEIAYFAIVGGITILFGFLLLFYVPKIDNLINE